MAEQEEMVSGCTTAGSDCAGGLVSIVVLGSCLNLVILEICCNPNDSLIPSPSMDMNRELWWRDNQITPKQFNNTLKHKKKIKKKKRIQGM